MDKKERISLIRKGNEYFNNGDIKNALEIFVKTKYKDGLTRVADYYFYDKKLPLMAVKIYKMAGKIDKVDEIYDRMIMALGQLLGKEKPGPKVTLPPLKISPKLKILAEEILRREEQDNKKK